VTDCVRFWLFHEIIPGDLGCGGSLNGFLGTVAAVIAWVRIKEGEFIMVLTDGVKVQVGDMTEALREEDTFWETTAGAFMRGTLPRVKRRTLPRVRRGALPRVTDLAHRGCRTFPMGGAFGASRARGR
jgi:hypothetical protein